MISHSIPLPITPNQPPPKIPTITLPSHTTWSCNQHITQLSICFVVHYCIDIISYSNCSFHLTPPSKEWDPFGKNPISHLSYLLGNQGHWTEFSYRIRMPVGYWWVSSMCEPWQAPPQDHPKGLVHGTEITICSDKDSFYLPFFTRMQLYVLTNSVGLMQKNKDQALILKLGKSTSQEINPNYCPRVLGTFGNWESKQLSAHYAVGKRTKNNPPFRVARVRSEITTLWEI